MFLVDSLCGEHRALEAHARALLDCLDRPADPVAVAAARTRLAEALRDHCDGEDRELYGPLLASGDQPAAGAAQRFKDEHGPLAADFERYLTAWPIHRIAADWACFAASTRQEIEGLRARIASEEAELYAHARRVMLRRAA